MPAYLPFAARREQESGPAESVASTLLGATWPLLLFAALLLVLSLLGDTFMNAARASATAESLWSKARARAVLHLTQYARAGNPQDLEAYESEREVMLSFRTAREALTAPHDDKAAALVALRRSGLVEADAESLVFAFRWLIRNTPFAIRIEPQRLLDADVDALHALAQQLRERPRPLPAEALTATLERITALNDRMRAQELVFTQRLASQGRWLRYATDLLTIGAIVLLLAAVMITTGRTLRRMGRTEHSLRQANERFDLANAAANDGIWDWDLLSRDFSWSARLPALLGYAEDDLFARSFQAIASAHPEDEPALRRAVRDYLEKRSPRLDLDYRVRCANGDYRWVHVRGQALWDANGQPLRLVGTLSDIHERKTTEKALAHALQAQRQAAEDLDNALMGANAAHWAFAPKTGTVLHAQRWFELLGRREMPATVDEWMQLVHPEDRDRRRFVLQQHLDNHTAYCESEYRMLHADGHWVPVRSRGRALSRDASGAALYFAAVIMDISQQVAVRRLEQDQFRFLQAVVNGVDTGLMVANENTVSFINAPFRRFLGYGPYESLHGLALDALVATPDQKLSRERRAKVLAGIPVPPTRITLNKRDGGTVTLLANVSAFTWNGVPHLIASATPLSAGEELGMRIDEAQRRFEHVLVSELEQQQAHIARELHDSLGSVLAGTSLLLSSGRSLPTAQSMRPVIDQAIEQVTRAAEMSRVLSHGLMPVGENRGGVVGALEQLAHDMSQVPGLRCDINIEADARGIDADTGTHVYRVAQEAVNNATRHGKASQIEISLSLEDDHYLLTVEDNGRGFDVTSVPATRPGIGLQSMMARAKAIRGTVGFERSANGGSIVALAWPHDISDATLH